DVIGSIDLAVFPKAQASRNISAVESFTRCLEDKSDPPVRKMKRSGEYSQFRGRRSPQDGRRAAVDRGSQQGSAGAVAVSYRDDESLRIEPGDAGGPPCARNRDGSRGARGWIQSSDLEGDAFKSRRSQMPAQRLQETEATLPPEEAPDQILPEGAWVLGQAETAVEPAGCAGQGGAYPEWDILGQPCMSGCPEVESIRDLIVVPCLDIPFRDDRALAISHGSQFGLVIVVAVAENLEMDGLSLG